MLLFNFLKMDSCSPSQEPDWTNLTHGLSLPHSPQDALRPIRRGLIATSRLNFLIFSTGRSIGSWGSRKAFFQWGLPWQACYVSSWVVQNEQEVFVRIWYLFETHWHVDFWRVVPHSSFAKFASTSLQKIFIPRFLLLSRTMKYDIRVTSVGLFSIS